MVARTMAGISVSPARWEARHRRSPITSSKRPEAFPPGPRPAEATPLPGSTPPVRRGRPHRTPAGAGVDSGVTAEIGSSWKKQAPPAVAGWFCVQRAPRCPAGSAAPVRRDPSGSPPPGGVAGPVGMRAPSPLPSPPVSAEPSSLPLPPRVHNGDGSRGQPSGPRRPAEHPEETRSAPRSPRPDDPARTRACHPWRLRGTAGHNDLLGPGEPSSCLPARHSIRRAGSSLATIPTPTGRGFPHPASRPPPGVSFTTSPPPAGGFAHRSELLTVRQCEQADKAAEQVAPLARSGPPVRPASTAVPVRAGRLRARRRPRRAGHPAEYRAGDDPQPCSCRVCRRPR